MKGTAYRLLWLVGIFVLAGALAGAGIGFFTGKGFLFAVEGFHENAVALVLLLSFGLAAGLAAYAFVGWIQERRANQRRVQRFAEVKALIDQERKSFAALSRLWQQKEVTWKEEKLERQRGQEAAAEERAALQAERDELAGTVASLESEVARLRKDSEEAGSREEEATRQRERLEQAQLEARGAGEQSERERAELASTIQSLTARQTELASDLDQVRRLRDEAIVGRDSLAAQVAELEAAKRALSERLAAREGELDQVVRERSEQASSVELLSAKVAELEARAGEAERERHAEERERSMRQELAFLAKLSGTLRGPIARVAQLARGAREKPERALPEIVSLADAFMRKLDDLLDLGKLHAGLYKLVVSAAPLERIVSRAVAEWRPAAAARAVTLTFGQAGADLGTLDLDERLVGRCLGCLLSNAIRFTPRAGRVEVRASVARSAGRAQAVIEVRDTGIGIPPEEHEAIFEPFVRAAQRRTELSEEGVGLGLALARELVRLHGGGIAVTSAVGAGSVFTLTVDERQPAQNRVCDDMGDLIATELVR